MLGGNEACPQTRKDLGHPPVAAEEPGATLRWHGAG